VRVFAVVFAATALASPAALADDAVIPQSRLVPGRDLGDAPPGAVAPPPKVIRYWNHNAPLPAGYHVETRLHAWLFLVGAPIFAATYWATASLGSSQAGIQGHSWGFVPIIGPIVWIAERNTGNVGLDLVADDFFLFLGLGQLVGATLTAAGFLARDTVLVRDASSLFRVVPLPILLGTHTPGLGFTGAF
jgi:hypothetical protein